jgi:hypothetical protein
MYKEITEDLNAGSSRGLNESLEAVNPRKSYSCVPVILLVGGVDGSRILETVSCYVPSVNKWCELGRMNVPRWK